MAYADYEFYSTRYFGDELTEATAPKWLERTRRIPARIMRIAAVLAGIVLTVDLALKTYL